MNPRERNMAILLGAFILLGGGGFFLYQFLYLPYTQQTQAKARLLDEINEKTVSLAKLRKDLPKLAGWRLMSLPSDPVDARREYGYYLQQLMNRSGWKIKSFSPGLAEVKPGPTLPNKKAIYTSMTFSVDAEASENSIVQFFEEFAKSPVMHKIRTFNVMKPPDKQGGGGGDQKGGKGFDLGKGGIPGFGKGGIPGFGKGGVGKKGKGGLGDLAGKGGFGGKGIVGRGERLPVQMQVEALIIGGPEKHWTAMTGFDDRLVALDALAGLRGLWVTPGWMQAVPFGLAQVPWVVSPQGMRPPQALAQVKPERNYPDIARARLFLGAPEAVDKGSTKPPSDWSDVTKFVKLIRIAGSTTSTEVVREAELINLLQPLEAGRGPDKSRIRLRDVDKGGFKMFSIRDDDDEVVVRGEVLRVTAREVYFSVDGSIYVIHIGDTLEQAMERAVPAAEAKKLGLLPPDKAE